ncbi:hypothetical protein GCM10018965_066280 [Nonomuraea roseola]
MTQPGKVLYIIVCAAGPAADVGRLVALAQDDGWTVQIIATPPALDFIDAPELEQQTGRPVRSQYRKPSEPKSPRADAIIVAPPPITRSTSSPKASPTPTPWASCPRLLGWGSRLWSCRS